MAKYSIEAYTLSAIGDAVREKDGTTEPILVRDLAERIRAIETGGGGGSYSTLEELIENATDFLYIPATFADANGVLTLPQYSNLDENYTLSNLKDLVFGEGITKITTNSTIGTFTYVGYNTTGGCKFTFPATLKEISGCLFLGSKIQGKHLNLPEGIEVLGENVFMGLEPEAELRITIPSTVTTIGEDAFKYTGKEIYFKGTPWTIGNYAFDLSNPGYKQSFYVPWSEGATPGGRIDDISIYDYREFTYNYSEGGGGGDSIPDEAFNITGSGSYRFAENGWNWFIDKYGDKIKTKDITNASYMFQNSSKLVEIPFDINCSTTASGGVTLTYLFNGCEKLTTIPKITAKAKQADNMFSVCYSLKEIPEEAVKDIDWSIVDSQTSAYYGSRGTTFANCYSLRKFPMSFLAHGNPYAATSYSIYNYLFNNCYTLDEAVDLPVIHRQASWTSNAFNSTFGYCNRLKRLTFETNEDGSPIKVDGWSKQAIDLSKQSGYAYTSSLASKYGIPSNTEMKDDDTYQTYKNHLDSWANNAFYSRYNKDSAVETINTLPDLSGGKGGNTIKFLGVAGKNTDGGAINTMTEEEIAVATAKGWTVTYA